MKYKKSELTKNKLIDTFAKLVIDKGYKNITVRDICKESGVSNGAFYHHFGSKDALACAIYKKTDLTITPELLDELKKLSPIIGLRFLLSEQVKYIYNEAQLATTDYYKILLDTRNDYIFDNDRPYYKTVYNHVHFCIHENLIRIKDCNYVTNYIFRFLRGLIFDWCIHNGSYNLIEQFNVDLELAWFGLINTDN